MGKEGDRDERDVATCAVVANGWMHTVRATYVSAQPVWWTETVPAQDTCQTHQYERERFSCTANAVRPWIVEALGRMKMRGPAK